MGPLILCHSYTMYWSLVCCSMVIECPSITSSHALQLCMCLFGKTTTQKRHRGISFWGHVLCYSCTIYTYYFYFYYRFILIKIYPAFSANFTATFSVNGLMKVNCSFCVWVPLVHLFWRNNLVPVTLSFQNQENAHSRSLGGRLSGKHLG